MISSRCLEKRTLTGSSFRMTDLKERVPDDSTGIGACGDHADAWEQRDWAPNASSHLFPEHFHMDHPTEPLNRPRVDNLPSAEEKMNSELYWCGHEASSVAKTEFQFFLLPFWFKKTRFSWAGTNWLGVEVVGIRGEPENTWLH